MTYGTQDLSCPDGTLSKPHAAVSAIGLGMNNSYCYDLNGNMVRRTIGGVDYYLTLKADPRQIAELFRPLVNQVHFVTAGAGRPKVREA